MNWEVKRTKTKATDVSQLTNWTAVFSLSFILFYNCIIACMCAGALGGHKRVLDTFELELQIFVSLSGWMLQDQYVISITEPSTHLYPSSFLKVLSILSSLSRDATIDSWNDNFSQTEPPWLLNQRKNRPEIWVIPWLPKIPSMLENQGAWLKSSVEATCWFYPWPYYSIRLNSAMIPEDYSNSLPLLFVADLLRVECFLNNRTIQCSRAILKTEKRGNLHVPKHIHQYNILLFQPSAKISIKSPIILKHDRK